MKASTIIVAFLTGTLLSCSSAQKPNKDIKRKPNVLFIAIDDLRPELACYGAKQIISPHMDRLADEGMLFTSAYTQQAVCAPSRNTLMTGIRPDGLGITDLATFFRTKAPDIVTLSQHFLQHGYQAEGMGKIYHTGHGNSNDTLSWSNKHFTPAAMVKKRQAIQSGDTMKLHTCFPSMDGKKLPWLKSNMADNMLDDGLVTQHALNRLEALQDTSFFMAVGFRKPHLPFVAPKKYWDLYKPSDIMIPGKEKPNIHPNYAFSNWGELRKYYGMPSEGYANDQDARNLIHGYYACISYIDAQVGLLISKLKDLGIYDNTIIVLWGDHGWKLGEYGAWCKHTNYEIDTRIPLMVKSANASHIKGGKSTLLVETVDIYPTLCEMAGLEKPDHLQGSSFMQALHSSDFHWEDVAFSQYPRTTTLNNEKIKVMGYAMRTQNYRLIKWIAMETRETLDVELYHHSNQPIELKNLAHEAEYKKVLDELLVKFEKEYIKEHK